MKKLSVPLFVKLLSLVLSLLLLGGCVSSYSRPPEYTDANTDDLPVIAETAPPVTKKRVAITFDDGPQNYDERTKKIVDELDLYGFHATFFVVGNRVTNGDAITYAVEHGNEIGIHGYTHSSDAYYDSCSDDRYEEEISKTARAIYKYLPDYQIKTMRPVGGKISQERIRESAYAVILWSIDSDDWGNRYYSGIPDEEAQEVVDTIVANVMDSVSDGDIILLHDIYESTYDATRIILKRLYEEGYEVVSVSQLLGEDMQPGRAYSRKE